MHHLPISMEPGTPLPTTIICVAEKLIGQGQRGGVWGRTSDTVPSHLPNAPIPGERHPIVHLRMLAPPSGHKEHCSWSRSAWNPNLWSIDRTSLPSAQSPKWAQSQLPVPNRHSTCPCRRHSLSPELRPDRSKMLPSPGQTPGP